MKGGKDYLIEAELENFTWKCFEYWKPVVEEKRAMLKHFVNGRMNFKQFYSFVTEKYQTDKYREDAIDLLLLSYGEEMDNLYRRISPRFFAIMFRVEFGILLTGEQLKQQVEIFDKDGDGHISYEDFKEVMSEVWF